ncbi:MAG TPA: FAD-dependent oxidoreductase [Gemmatimonadales bacterium]|jgi:NADPH-dependent 2,4-dienoyl-CoA reductase/sulfur reductase-like enzyme/nitrite reductase/ring-hydroxylating ferredoxin subunit|nr:FAD-dependent oxidoreductase [Gemmatimonadales bacterium]
MTDQDAKLSGPDLAAGITANTLRPGDKLLGHAAGEPVLLARVGDDYYAIGATCTHYGGPLAEGVIDGATVRCPWHHACFSLKSGEPLRAPALSPVPCWQVEQSGDRLRVAGKVERDALAPVAPLPRGPETPREIAIIGAGAAGASAAEMLRRSGFDGRVVVIDGDSDSPYDRPNLSKDYLAGNAPEEWIPLRPAGYYAERRIELIRARATRLSLAARTVDLDGAGHAPVHYDALLLAPGAEPVRLPLAGGNGRHVHYLRSLADSREIIAAAKRAKHAVVIGGSFIGLEVAASLRARGLAVDLVAPETLPLERVLGAELGRFIKALHEEKGVVFHLEHRPERIERDAVVLDDGTRLRADLVVIGVGVKPRLELAEQAGIAIDRGVVVNEYLETSAPGVFAAGDLARWPDPHSGERIRVEHWVVAERMGQAAARNILGAQEPFTQVPFFWSAHYDVSINYVGHAERWDSIRVEGSAEQRDVAVRFERGGKTLALATIFRDQESLRMELELERTVG